jgi:hypothetical protein
MGLPAPEGVLPVAKRRFVSHGAAGMTTSGGGGDAMGVAAARRNAGGGMRLFSLEYYALCFGGGMLAAGTTHLAITPLDVLKVNMQVRMLRILWDSVGCWSNY